MSMCPWLAACIAAVKPLGPRQAQMRREGENAKHIPGASWYLESQVAQNNKPQYPEVAQNGLRLSPDFSPLAFQVLCASAPGPELAASIFGEACQPPMELLHIGLSLAVLRFHPLRGSQLDELVIGPWQSSFCRLSNPCWQVLLI